MVFLDIQLDDLAVALSTEYPNTGSNFLGQFVFQYPEAVFGDPDNVILAVPYGM
jgi:hypothetical protein